MKKIAEEKKFIKLINLDMSKSKDILEDLRERALNGKKPFKNGSDRGFKDSLIWHCFMGSIEPNKFDYFYFLTENSNDFNYELEEEFKNKFLKNLKIFNDTKSLISELNEHYHLFEDYPELLAYLKTKYFEDQLAESVSSTFSLSIDDFKLTDFCKGIEELSLQEYEGYGLSEVISKENMDILKVIEVAFFTEGKNYRAWVVFDSDAKEIVLVNLDLSSEDAKAEIQTN